jgi:hypothetical protein
MKLKRDCESDASGGFRNVLLLSFTSLSLGQGYCASLVLRGTLKELRRDLMLRYFSAGMNSM